MMITAIQRDMEARFQDKDGDHMYLQIAHTNSPKAAMEFREELLALYPGREIYVDCLSLSVSCHIGPGALAVACTRKII